MSEIKIIQHSEESFSVQCNGVDIGNFNHDAHGWDGMRAVENVVTGLAKLLEIPVVEIDEQEEEE